MSKTINRENNKRLLVSAADAAKLLSISPRTLWSLTRQGEIPSCRLGGRVLYSEDSLREWINARINGGEAPSN